MKNEQKDIEEKDASVFRVLEFITELVGWLRIVASPLLIGLIIGAFIYFPNPSAITLIIGILIAAIGLVIGILWANSKWKGRGTMWFLSRIDATPELDNPTEENKKESSHDA